MVDIKDFEILDQRYDQRYVRKEDCNDIRLDVEHKIDNMDKAVAVIGNKIDTVVKILAVVAVPVLAIAVKLLFGG